MTSPIMYLLYKLEIVTFPISLLVSPFIQDYDHHPKKQSEAITERMACQRFFYKNKIRFC